MAELKPGVVTELLDDHGRVIAVSGSVLSPELAQIGDELAAADDLNMPSGVAASPDFDWFS